MATNKHTPTEKSRAEVEALASFGLPQEDIARYIGISHVTLRKYYDAELSLSAIKANSAVGKYLFSLASGQAIKDGGATHGDCKTAAMFWAKTRMGWRERQEVDHKSTDGTMSPRSGIDLSKAPDEVLKWIVSQADAASSD